MTLKLQSLNINLPFGIGGANIVVTEAQKAVVVDESCWPALPESIKRRIHKKQDKNYG